MPVFNPLESKNNKSEIGINTLLTFTRHERDPNNRKGFPEGICIKKVSKL